MTVSPTGVKMVEPVPTKLTTTVVNVPKDTLGKIARQVRYWIAIFSNASCKPICLSTCTLFRRRCSNEFKSPPSTATYLTAPAGYRNQGLWFRVPVVHRAIQTRSGHAVRSFRIYLMTNVNGGYLIHQNLDKVILISEVNFNFGVILPLSCLIFSTLPMDNLKLLNICFKELIWLRKGEG